MATTEQARALGIEHGAANMMPFGAPEELDEAAVMTALGITTVTTPANEAHRIALLDCYAAGLQDALDVSRSCVRATA